MKWYEHPIALRIPIMAVFFVSIWPIGLGRYTIATLMVMLLQWVDFRAARTGLVPLSVYFFDNLFPLSTNEEDEEEEEDDDSEDEEE